MRLPTNGNLIWDHVTLSVKTTHPGILVPSGLGIAVLGYSLLTGSALYWAAAPV